MIMVTMKFPVFWNVTCITELSAFSENPSVSVFGVEELIFSYEDILLLWKKESSKLNLSSWTEKKKKSTAYFVAQPVPT